MKIPGFANHVAFAVRLSGISSRQAGSGRFGFFESARHEFSTNWSRFLGVDGTFFGMMRPC
jgi:hypothetical protein